MLERDEPLRPVEQASWEDCRDLGAASGLRLPSEAEWEYGARGGTATAYSFGDDPALLADHDWYTANAKGRSHPVGEKKPNRFGLHDVQGNLSEWCEDGWSDDYAGAPVDGSATTPSGAFRRPVRGGNYLSTPRSTRVSTRDGVAPDFRSRYVGLRPARSLF
jgi:formylglycine-generating enzyme required for sulfatase activity